MIRMFDWLILVGVSPCSHLFSLLPHSHTHSLALMAIHPIRVQSQPPIRIPQDDESSRRWICTTYPSTLASGTSFHDAHPQRQRRSSHLIRILVLSIALITTNWLAFVSGEPTYDSNPFSFGLDFAGGNGFENTLAITLIIFGLICLVLGVRLFKVTLFLITWLCVGGLTYYLSMLASKGDSKASFIAAMIIGLIAGFIVLKLVNFGLMLVGSFGMFVLWSCFITLFPNVVPPGALYTALCLVLISGAILAIVFPKWLLLFLTPIIGTFCFSQGLSKYLNDPSLQLSIFHTLHGDTACDSKQCIGLFAGFGAITMIGFCIQWYWTSGLRANTTKRKEPEHVRLTENE